MWTAYVEGMQRRWRQVAASAAVCAGVGAALWAIVPRTGGAGLLTWAMGGTGCALLVGLIWPLLTIRRLRAGSVPASMTQASALSRLAARRHWTGAALRVLAGMTAAFALYLVGLMTYRVLAPRRVAPPPPSAVAAAAPESPAAPATKPAPAPVITIGDYILVPVSANGS
jgi:hypothetical protein